MSEARRCEVCGKTFVDPFTQPDHDCRGKPTSWGGEDALNSVTEGRPKGFKRVAPRENLDVSRSCCRGNSTEA
jgi:hypothetical protein